MGDGDVLQGELTGAIVHAVEGGPQLRVERVGAVGVVLAEHQKRVRQPLNLRNSGRNM